jgi:DNA polymerase III epsilon subunit-like protein
MDANFTKNLLRYRRNQRYLVFDFETCSLSLFPHTKETESKGLNLPWQLGWSVYNGDKEVLSREDWIFWPDLVEKMQQYGKDAAAITGWTESDYLRKAKSPEPILEDFEKYLYDPNVISITANGTNFDQYIHNIYRERLGKNSDWSWAKRHYDIQVIHKAKTLGVELPALGSNEWLFTSMKVSQIVKRGLKSSLSFMCKEFDVPYNEFRHHKEALYDVELTKDIFYKQIQDIDIYV